jgi:hypothetical protein
MQRSEGICSERGADVLPVVDCDIGDDKCKQQKGEELGLTLVVLLGALVLVQDLLMGLHCLPLLLPCLRVHLLDVFFRCLGLARHFKR